MSTETIIATVYGVLASLSVGAILGIVRGGVAPTVRGDSSGFSWKRFWLYGGTGAAACLLAVFWNGVPGA